MEDMKSQIKEPLSLDVRMVFSKLSQKGELNRDTALEAGAYISAQFINSLNKMIRAEGKPALSIDEQNTVYETVEELFSEHFEDEYSDMDYEILKLKSLKLMGAENAQQEILDYFKKTLKK